MTRQYVISNYRQRSQRLYRFYVLNRRSRPNRAYAALEVWARLQTWIDTFEHMTSAEFRQKLATYRSQHSAQAPAQLALF